MTDKQKIVPASVTTAANLIHASQHVNLVYLDERIRTYIVNIVYASRQPDQFGLPQLKHCIEHGASPRATIALAMAAKAHAFMDARAYVVPEDIQELATDVLQHRIAISYEAEADNISSSDVIDTIIEKINVP